MSEIKNSNIDFLIENTDSGDILNIESIDVLGNSIYDITKVLKKAESKKIALLISDDIYLDFRDNDKHSDSIIKLLDSICNMQKKKVKNNLQNAVSSEENVGRDKLSPNQIPDIFWENLHRYETRDLNKTEFAEVCNCSRPTLDKWFRCIGQHPRKSKRNNGGKAKLTPKKIPSVFWENIYRYEAKELNKTEFAKVCNCSRPTLYKWLNSIENNK